MEGMDNFMMLNDSEMSVNSANQIAEMAKALLAPGGVVDMYTAPGGVLTMQSLEGMLANLTLQATDFTLWQDMNKIKAYSTVEEYDQQIGLGISDGGFVGQMENPEFQDADFLKQIAIVKFMSEGWKVADVQEAMLRGWSERDSRSVMLLPQERAGVSVKASTEGIEDILRRVVAPVARAAWIFS